MRLSRAVASLSLIALALLAGCQTQRRGAAVQPTLISVNGFYKHPASGMAFPVKVGEFDRDQLLQYSRDGRSIAGRFSIKGATSAITAMVYIFPASGGASGERCNAQLQDATANFAQSLPRMSRLAVEPFGFTENGRAHRGTRALFGYEEGLGSGDVRPGSAEIVMFCDAAGPWQLEYRFTYPRDMNAKPLIDDFMQNLPWTFG